MFHGLHRYALKALMYSPDFSGQPINETLNSWAGDPILIAADEAPPNQGMVTTSPEHPNRNLYELAKQEYRDISLALFKYLITRKMAADFEETLFRRARKSVLLLMTIVGIHAQTNSKVLEMALEKNIGKNWKKKYGKMAKKMVKPMPPVF